MGVTNDKLLMENFISTNSESLNRGEGEGRAGVDGADCVHLFSILYPVTSVLYLEIGQRENMRIFTRKLANAVISHAIEKEIFFSTCDKFVYNIHTISVSCLDCKLGHLR